MVIPEPPVLTKLEYITPSIYEASINCLAKAAWFAFGDAGVLPQHPTTILGTAFHTVIAIAYKGELPVAGVSDRVPARELFDKTAQKLHLGAHPLVKLKFPSVDRLPFYNLTRERVALAATSIAASRLKSAASAAGAPRVDYPAVKMERRLCSRDGRLIGRADHIDGRSGVVVDYKTGRMSEGEPCVVSDSEVRQLRLYAYLAAENGTDIGTGAVVRGDGQRCEIKISPGEAEAEADCAKKQLGRLNAAVTEGASFRDLASPSPRNCSFCPCLPFCGPFWAEANPEWTEDCGTHVEGNVAEIESRQIQGVSLSTLILSTRTGTVFAQRVLIEQIPIEWMRIGDLDLPRIGDAIRVVHGRQVETDGRTVVIRVDKALTAVWRLGQDNASGA